MNAQDLESRLVDALRQHGASMTVARNRAAVIIHWLGTPRASDRGPGGPSRATIARRRAILRSAGLSPATTPIDLAEIAAALRIEPTDRACLVRLAWQLRGRTGPLRYEEAPVRFAEVVNEIEVVMRAQPGAAERCRD